MDTTPENEANAQLIVASPDMYEALVGIKNNLMDFLDAMLDMGLHVQVKLFQEKMTGLPAVVQAIDKAEGKNGNGPIHCHRKICQKRVRKERAYWNTSTREWYCESCAILINTENRPFLKGNDSDLCVPYSHAVPDEDLEWNQGEEQ
jgi:hypothetical protein